MENNLEKKESPFVYNEDTKFDFTKNPYTWGLDILNKELYRPDKNGELIVLFGHPMMWKTEFSFFLMRKNMEIWIPTLFFWLEIWKKAIIHRACLKMCWVDQNTYDEWNCTDYQKAMMEDKRKYMEEKFWNILVSITKTPTIDELIDEMETKYIRNWCRVFVIDNLGKIDMEWKTENDIFWVISWKLQTFALSHQAQVILLHHVVKQNAWNSKWKDIDDIFDLKPAGEEWFRGSKKIKDNAIRMLEIYRKFDSDDVYLFQYKHWPTGKRAIWNIKFIQWEYIESDF